jgi:hypothetical protein
MRLLGGTVVGFFISAALSLPSPSNFLNQGPRHVIGPPTRSERLAEGWIDEAAKYFRKSLVHLLFPYAGKLIVLSQQTNLGMHELNI